MAENRGRRAPHKVRARARGMRPPLVTCSSSTSNHRQQQQEHSATSRDEPRNVNKKSQPRSKTNLGRDSNAARARARQRGCREFIRHECSNRNLQAQASCKCRHANKKCNICSSVVSQQKAVQMKAEHRTARVPLTSETRQPHTRGKARGNGPP